ncbi:MAG TPA: STN domain-containing protein [Planctomycetota bacterium]|nr:STN domain-containing protein [Planctomycetota bacterium]
MAPSRWIVAGACAFLSLLAVELSAAEKSPAKAANAEKMPEWEQEMRKRLKEKVTVNFKDTALEEAIAKINETAKINIVLDPALAEDMQMSLSFSMKDVTAEEALNRVLTFSGLKAVYREKSLFITAKEPPAEAKDEKKR